jgi:phage anti-repressor protein
MFRIQDHVLYGEQQPCVNTRELYMALGVSVSYKVWRKKCEFELNLSEDDFASGVFVSIDTV